MLKQRFFMLYAKKKRKPFYCKMIIILILNDIFHGQNEQKIMTLIKKQTRNINISNLIH